MLLPIESLNENGKYNIGFVLNLNLRFGGGGERALLQYIKHRPTDFNAYIFQTDYYDVPRLGEKEIEQCLYDVPVVTFPSTETRLRNLRKSEIFLVLNEFIFVPIFLKLIRSRRADLKDLLAKMDVIYLFSNNYEYLLDRSDKAIVIGSTHGMSVRGQLKHFEILFKVLIKLIQKNVIYKKVDGFHVLRKFYEQDQLLERRCDFLLPNGVDTDLFYPRNSIDSSRDKIVFLFVGRIEKSKGVELLADAWRIFLDSVSDPDRYELIVVGNGRANGIFEDLRNLKRLSSLSTMELADVYRNADVFLFPSSGEVYPMVILEALASGLFVVCTSRVDGVFDEFDRLGALRYTELEPQSFATEMKRAADNLEMEKHSVLNAVELIRERFTWSKIVEQFYTKIRKSKEGP